MAQILQEAGVPDGVFNVVTGSGAAIGDHLVAHPGVDKVAFTGSTEIGARAQLAGSTLKPFTAELGGNAANILFADADLNTAMHTVIAAFVFNSGQFCMADPGSSSNVRSTTSCSASSPRRCRTCPSATSRIPRR